MHTHSRLVVGVDLGETYTDAGEGVATAKLPTVPPSSF
jgi:hypothetical protein